MLHSQAHHPAEVPPTNHMQHSMRMHEQGQHPSPEQQAMHDVPVGQDVQLTDWQRVLQASSRACMHSKNFCLCQSSTLPQPGLHRIMTIPRSNSISRSSINLWLGYLTIHLKFSEKTSLPVGRLISFSDTCCRHRHATPVNLMTFNCYTVSLICMLAHSRVLCWHYVPCRILPSITCIA